MSEIDMWQIEQQNFEQGFEIIKTIRLFNWVRFKQKRAK